MTSLDDRIAALAARLARTGTCRDPASLKALLADRACRRSELDEVEAERLARRTELES